MMDAMSTAMAVIYFFISDYYTNNSKEMTQLGGGH